MLIHFILTLIFSARASVSVRPAGTITRAPVPSSATCRAMRSRKALCKQGQRPAPHRRSCQGQTTIQTIQSNDLSSEPCACPMSPSTPLVGAQPRHTSQPPPMPQPIREASAWEKVTYLSDTGYAWLPQVCWHGVGGVLHCVVGWMCGGADGDAPTCAYRTGFFFG